MKIDTIQRRSSQNGATVGRKPICIGSDDDDPRPKWFSLTMYPYPSGILHVGHWYAFTVPDSFARFQADEWITTCSFRWDSMRLDCRRKTRRSGTTSIPATWTYENIAHMRRQYDLMGAMIDWARELATSDPDYYRWNQWIFLKMLEKGLAYRKDGRGLVVSERPNGARQRAGARWQYLRTLRHRGLQARSRTVVFQDHRVCRRASR